jgi:hypothetical protein
MSAQRPQNGDPERESDHNLHQCRDIVAVKARLEDISETLNALAVQEQKILTLHAALENSRAEMQRMQGRFDSLQTSHDRCTIGAVSADLAWIKWFVMGNTMALLGMVVTLIAKLLQHP